MHSETNLAALSGASKNAEKALGAISSLEFKDVPEEDKIAWAMAALIHCDLCRLVVFFDECPVEGLARLLSLADISSKLFEARNWYNNAGTKLILSIAERKSIDVAEVRKQIDNLKKTHEIHSINKYEDYRNKFGYHYDANAISYLQRFGQEDSGHFFKVLMSFVRFSIDWTQITKDLVQKEYPNAA